MINRTKFGDCSKCGATDTNVVKIGRELFCLSCNRQIKVAKYEANSRQKTKVRNLLREQIRNGNMDEAERQILVNELDFCFSRIVRLKETNELGRCKCYTCEYENNWTKLQCGHFVDRGNMGLRFDFRNGRPQCPKCNCNLDGNLIEYAKRLNEEHNGLPEQLIEQSREPYHYSISELKQTLISYRAILNNLEKKLAPHLK